MKNKKKKIMNYLIFKINTTFYSKIIPNQKNQKKIIKNYYINTMT